MFDDNEISWVDLEKWQQQYETEELLNQEECAD